jgi:phage recombination protein Bet
MTTAIAERADAPVSIAPQPKASILAKIAGRYSVEPTVMLETLKSTAFRQREGQSVTNEQMVALLIVADQYKLNPFTKEIYAFPDKGGIVPVVGVDGWARIINEHPAFDGMDFIDGPVDEHGNPEWIECVMYRKDRGRPIKVRERMKECRRGTQPWQSHPSRMLRHKAMIQCARVAFGFAGIYDEDEAERIIERDMGKATVVPAGSMKPRAKDEAPDQPPTPPTTGANAVGAAPAVPQSQPAPQTPAAATASDGGAEPSNATAPAIFGAEDSGMTPEPSGPAAAAPIPLTKAQVMILEKRMKAGEISRADVEKRFGKPFDALTMADFEAVSAFIADPSA